MLMRGRSLIYTGSFLLTDDRDWADHRLALLFSPQCTMVDQVHYLSPLTEETAEIDNSSTRWNESQQESLLLRVLSKAHGICRTGSHDHAKVKQISVIISSYVAIASSSCIYSAHLHVRLICLCTCPTSHLQDAKIKVRKNLQ